MAERFEVSKESRLHNVLSALVYQGLIGHLYCSYVLLQLLLRVELLPEAYLNAGHILLVLPFHRAG